MLTLNYLNIHGHSGSWSLSCNERCPKTEGNKCLNSPLFLESRESERKPKNEDVLWLFRSPYAHQYSWIGVGCGYGDRISERLRRGFNEMSVHMKSFRWMRLIFLLPQRCQIHGCNVEGWDKSATLSKWWARKGQTNCAYRNRWEAHHWILKTESNYTKGKMRWRQMHHGIG